MGKLLKTILSIHEEAFKEEKVIYKNEINNINKYIIEAAKNNKMEFNIFFDNELEEGRYDDKNNKYYFPMKNVMHYNNIKKLLEKYYTKEGFSIPVYDNKLVCINWNHLVQSEIDKWNDN